MDLFSPPSGSSFRDDAREARILRARHSALANAVDNAGGAAPTYASARCALQIYDGGMMPSSGNKIFLGYPVTFTDTEGEGMPQSASPDTSTSTPVYVLGTMAPSVGDILPAYAVGGRWVAERGSSNGSGTVGCSPCDIPQTNLTLSWVNPLSGNGSTMLTYTPIPVSWVTSACFNGLKAELVCTGGQLELRVIYWISGACPGPGLTQYCSNLRATPFGLTLSSYTCSPFSMIFQSRSAGCPAITLSGYTSFTVTP